MIHLSKRLRCVVDFIDGNVLADIGCDHGYVCIQAIQEQRVSKAYACDVAKGPLDNAKSTINKENLQDKITCILMNGIENLPEDVDTIVISGMGSSLIIQILDTSIQNIHLHSHLICCPHKDVDLFREFASKNGFEIIKEKVIFEDNHYYCIFDLLYTSNPYFLTNEEVYYGKNIEVDDTYANYIEYEYDRWNSIYQKLPDAKKERLENRINALKKIRI